jgi:hypothetical protein
MIHLAGGARPPKGHVLDVSILRRCPAPFAIPAIYRVREVAFLLLETESTSTSQTYGLTQFYDSIVAKIVIPFLRMKPTIRTHRSGDLGWIISKHGEIYSDEFGFDPNFETHIAAKIVSFIETSDAFNSLWLCELEGRRAGSGVDRHETHGDRRLNLQRVEVLDKAVHFSSSGPVNGLTHK